MSIVTETLAKMRADKAKGDKTNQEREQP
jgi:hypothetical protein